MSKTVTGLVIPANLDEVPFHKEVPAEDYLETLQEIVGGYIQPLVLSPALEMYLNEEGKLRGLPYNLVATSLFVPEGVLDFIVGNVVIFGRTKPDGSLTSVNPTFSANLIELVKTTKR